MRPKKPKVKPFDHGINIVGTEEYEAARRRHFEHHVARRHVTDDWKRSSHSRMLMLLSFQIIKMRNQIRRPWYCYYSVEDFGAPASSEFICPVTARRARTIKQHEAAQYRLYYSKCVDKSVMILAWLLRLDPPEYTHELHLYLLRFIVVGRNPFPRKVDAFYKNPKPYICRALG